MRYLLIVAVIAVGFAPEIPGLAQAPAAPKVQIAFEEGGLVTVIANNATPREILAEWARQGGSTFVNAERLPGGPISVQFTHQPEKDVMASLLRQAAGYVLGPRRSGSVGASAFEVVYIVPTSNPSGGAYVPNMSAPPRTVVSTPGSPDDELPPVQGRGVGPQPETQPSDPARPAGVSGVAVPVIPVPTTTGRGGGGGGGR